MRNRRNGSSAFLYKFLKLFREVVFIPFRGKWESVRATLQHVF